MDAGAETKVARVLIAGPLAPFVAAFELKLKNAGYSPLSAVTQKRLLAHLSRWLEAKRLSVADLTDARIQEFWTRVARRVATTWLITREALMPLLELLKDLEALPAPDVPVAGSSVDHLLGPVPPLLAGGTRFGSHDRGRIRESSPSLR